VNEALGLIHPHDNPLKVAAPENEYSKAKGNRKY
jgi:hypothetical protein